MKFKKPKRLGWIITGVVVVAFVVISLLPKPREVDMQEVHEGPLAQTIDAEGQTRYVHTYLVSMPATGTVSRVTIEPGDSVHAGQVIATYTPPAMDARQRASAQARASAADAMEREARQRLSSLEPLMEQAERRAERTQRLLNSGAIPKESAENAVDAVEQLRAEYEAAKARVTTTSYEARAARIAAAAAPGQRIEIEAPIDGVLLRRFEEQSRLMTAGMPLVEIGDPRTVEVVIDVLSTDAVKVRRGMTALIEGWGGDDTLRATIRTIEPAARVKISTLGVEEKRVDVVADLPEPPSVLGDAYKVDARIITWETDRTVIVPVSALFRDNGDWKVFVVEDGTAVTRSVEIGHQAALNAEVLSGLKAGETVIVHPPEDLEEGALVE